MLAHRYECPSLAIYRIRSAGLSLSSLSVRLVDILFSLSIRSIALSPSLSLSLRDHPCLSLFKICVKRVCINLNIVSEVQEAHGHSPLAFGTDSALDSCKIS